MKTPTARTYSRYSQDAARLFGHLIEHGRKQRHWTAEELAGRAGISRSTLRRIENGDLRCEIGIVFEVSTLVGVSLFGQDSQSIGPQTHRLEERLQLLPKRIRKNEEPIDDDF